MLEAPCKVEVTEVTEITAEDILDAADEEAAMKEAEKQRNLEEYDYETLRLVNDKATYVTELESRWNVCHSEAAYAKKSFESARDELRLLIRQRQDERGKPVQGSLFDDKVSDDPTTQKFIEQAEMWKQYPMSFDRWERWGLTARDVEILNGGETKDHGTHPITVFGDVMKFVTPNPANPSYARSLKDFKGFGDTAMERYMNAETAFWAWWSKGGESEFAREMGIVTDGPQTTAGTDVESALDVGQSAIGGHDEVTTDAPRTANGKRSKRKA
jgi:uncharacterized protein YhfF